MNYGDIIEYYDGTLDKNFNEAQKWAEKHNTTFKELIDRRDLPKRYFQIGEEPVQTEEELKEKVRFVRNSYLSYYDFTQLDDAPFTKDEKEKYREYRQYLRDYTNGDNWWLKNPDDWDTWLLSHYPVTGKY